MLPQSCEWADEDTGWNDCRGVPVNPESDLCRVHLDKSEALFELAALNGTLPFGE